MLLLRLARRRATSAGTRSLSTVGFVGAGNMGRGMAASLARAGNTVLQYDRDASALQGSAAQSTLIKVPAVSRVLLSSPALTCLPASTHPLAGGGWAIGRLRGGSHRRLRRWRSC